MEKGESPTLLVGVEARAATVENSVEVSHYPFSHDTFFWNINLAHAGNNLLDPSGPDIFQNNVGL